MAESKNDRARRRRDAVASLTAAKKKIDAAVAARQAAKSKVRPELDAAADSLRTAEDELRAAIKAAIASGALVPGDAVTADGYVVTATATARGKVSVVVRKIEAGGAPGRPGRGKKPAGDHDP
jgi:hypothetical protein